jgi:stress-induced morphogen
METSLAQNRVRSMKYSRNYDTVAFDERENAIMLFFAVTTGKGEIEDYLLLMKAHGEGLDEALYIEINEQQFAGQNLVKSAQCTDNMLTLDFKEPAAALNGAEGIILTFTRTQENRVAFARGVFDVLGDTLTGGHA